MFAWLLILLGAALVCGSALLVTGLRGRRIDDHLVCAKCRFDLSGVERTTCPECGRNVSGERAVRVGQRRRRPRCVVAGAALLAIVLVVGAVVGVGAAKGTNWNAYKPTGWLLFEARAGAPNEADAAIGEVAGRVISKSPPRKPQLDRFVEIALAHQADLDKPWGEGWSMALDVLVEQKLLTEAQLAEIRKHAYSFEMDARPIAREGDKASVRLRVKSRIGFMMSGGAVLVEAMRVTVNDEHQPNSVGRMYTDGGNSSMLTAVDVSSPGTARVNVDWRYAFVDGPMDEPDEGAWIEFTRTVSIRVVDRESRDGVGLVADEGARDAVRRAVKITNLAATPVEKGVSVQITVTCDRPPENLAFEVFLKQGDRDWRIGSVRGAAGNMHSTAFGAGIDGLERGDVDVIFRASENVIRGSIDMQTAWDGEIVFEGLPVTWPQANDDE